MWRGVVEEEGEEVAAAAAAAAAVVVFVVAIAIIITLVVVVVAVVVTLQPSHAPACSHVLSNGERVALPSQHPHALCETAVVCGVTVIAQRLCTAAWWSMDWEGCK